MATTLTAPLEAHVYTDKFSCLYFSYEIQLTKPVRRKGLGKFLMQTLEMIAVK